MASMVKKICLYWFFKIIARSSKCFQPQIITMFHVFYTDFSYVKNLVYHNVYSVYVS